MPRSRRGRAVSLSALVLGVTTGCGSSPAGPPPVECAQTTLVSASRTVAPNTKEAQAFTTPATGRLDVTVDWSLPVNIVSVALAQSPCSVDQLQASACNVYFSQFSPPKPLVNSTSLLRAGSYTVIVANPNPVPESFSVRVVLTSAGCPQG